MKLFGVETEEGEIRDFQRVFPVSPAAGLLNKVIVSIGKPYEEAIHSLGTGMDSIRQAQGALDALGRLVVKVEGLMKYDLEREDAVEDDEEEQDAPELRF